MRVRSGTSVSYLGLQGEKVENGRGDSAIEIQSLNHFRVLSDTPAQRRRQEYFNISIGEPPPETFRPPVGVAPTWIPTPAGIIAHEAGSGAAVEGP